MPSGPVFVEAIFALRDPDYAQHVCTTRVSRGRFFARMEITPEMLRDIFDYDPNTGVLRRRKNGKIVAGSAVSRWGHLVVRVLGRNMLIHRVAFAIVNGRFPSKCIDHINGNPADNRIANLREASISENGRNRLAQRNSKTGILGVSWNRALKKYQAQIKAPEKHIHLGFFATTEEAAAARKAAEEIYHGEFASHVSRKPAAESCDV